MDPREVLELIARSSGSDEITDQPPGEQAGLVHLTRLPARRPVTAPVPDDLPGLLRDRLELLGITSLYAHQAEALRRARAGEHLVVATGTASGKTLCYQLPVLETLLEDPPATALYLAPTKALGRDQLRGLRAWRLPALKAAVVDGDTPRAERRAIRETANWVLTNPDLVHHSLLPTHRVWADFLHRLRWIVVDESHTARGVFGSHVALVLRRLRRLCERYSADAQVILASATVGNPAEHAGALAGVGTTAIVQDASERGPLDVGLWQPPLTDPASGARRSLLRETGDLLASFVGAGIQTLVFTRSRKAAELIALFARQRLEDAAGEAGAAADHGCGDGAGGARVPLSERVRSYRAGYLPEERRELEQQLRDGHLLGVVATSALELGIDVAGVDAVVLAGFPGTIASFWQRLGRAGRTGGASAGVLVAGEDPLDQYLVHHPDDLLDRDPEAAIVDASNPYLLAPHLRCACEEAPLTEEDADRWFGPRAPGLLAEDVEAGRLRRRGGRHHWPSRRRAAGQIDLRSIGGRAVRIVDVATGEVIGDVAEARAHRQVHPGAVYLHQGEQYEIRDLDLERHLASAVRAPELGHTTRPRSTTEVTVLEELEGRSWEEVAVRLGRTRVRVTVTGYEVLRPGTGEVLERVDLDLPPVELRTVAVWYALPEGLPGEIGLRPGQVPGSLHAAEHAAIGMLPLLAMCDRWDVGGLSTPHHPDTARATVFVYDGFPGGAGLAERSYRRLPEHLRRTREAVAGCGCRQGCPSCVQSPKCGNGNEPLDKAGAVVLLDALLARAPRRREGGGDPGLSPTPEARR